MRGSSAPHPLSDPALAAGAGKAAAGTGKGKTGQEGARSGQNWLGEESGGKAVGGGGSGGNIFIGQETNPSPPLALAGTEKGPPRSC